jgi:hypothetical protein
VGAGGEMNQACMHIWIIKEKGKKKSNLP